MAHSHCLVCNSSNSTLWQGFIYDSMYLAYSQSQIQSSTARFSDLKTLHISAMYIMRQPHDNGVQNFCSILEKVQVLAGNEISYFGIVLTPVSTSGSESIEDFPLGRL